MDAQQFAYWLQGFAELSGDEPPTPAQWKSIRDHLGLVFKKVTPPIDVLRKVGDDFRIVPQPASPGILDHFRPQIAADPYRDLIKPTVTCSGGGVGAATQTYC